jgi:hypothetical protein
MNMQYGIITNKPYTEQSIPLLRKCNYLLSLIESSIMCKFDFVPAKQYTPCYTICNISKQKRPSKKARPNLSVDLYKLLFNLELVLVNLVFHQVFTLAAKYKTISGLFVLKILAAK